MRTCTHCGYRLGPEDVFCANCGTGQPLRNAQAGPGPDNNPEVAAYVAAPPVTVASGLGPAGLGAPAGSARTQGSGPAAGAGAADGQPGQNGTQKAYFASTRGTQPASGAVPARAGETIEQKYMRHTRNATVFIAVIVGIFTTLVIIGTIWAATTVARLDSDLNGVNLGNNSNCLSQGGTNPDC
jgi:zinc-ribbon domain